MYSALKAGKIEMSAVKCFLCAHTNKVKINEKRSKMDDVSIKKEGDGELWLLDKGYYFIPRAITFVYNRSRTRFLGAWAWGHMVLASDSAKLWL